MLFHRSYLLGIAGASASGKTFLLSQLQAQAPDNTFTAISMDHYYKPLNNLPKDEEGLVNFDHPDSIALDELYRDLSKLLRGEPVERMEYGFNNPKHIAKRLQFEPRPIIAVEGLLIFHLPELSKLFDLKIFIEAEEHVKLGRRLKRDMSQRGYTLESILKEYEKFVAPMYYQYVLPQREQCDLIIQNNTHMYRAVNVLVNHLRQVIG